MWCWPSRFQGGGRSSLAQSFQGQSLLQGSSNRRRARPHSPQRVGVQVRRWRPAFKQRGRMQWDGKRCQLDQLGSMPLPLGLSLSCSIGARGMRESYFLLPVPLTGCCVQQFLRRRCGISGHDLLDNDHKHDPAPRSAVEPQAFQNPCCACFCLGRRSVQWHGSFLRAHACPVNSC